MVQDATVDPGCGAALFPLSPMQEGMLFHRLEAGVGGVDVEQVVCACRHPLGAPEFEQACALVVRRHDALRTCFVWREGKAPRQQVLPPEAVRLPVRVLHFATADDATRVIESYLEADRRAGFARLDAPLARVALFQTDEEQSWFVFTYHHLVLDARGMHTLFKDLLDAHDALIQGRTAALMPGRPYREYIAWLQTLDLHRAETFWREQLGDLRSPTVLPLPHPAEEPALGDATPGELGLLLDTGLTGRLRAAAQRHEVTLNTLLQGAWALVLSRYTGENDVVFGAVRACRHVPVEGAGTMVGMLINTVPLRVRLASAAAVDHWLRGLREQWLALRDYEHTPLMQVQRWSGVGGGRPLFDTVFNLHDPAWTSELRRLGGVWEKREFDVRCQPNYPLALDLFCAETVRVRAFFDRRRFGVDAVARLLGHFRTAAEALADPRTDTLGGVSLLNVAERSRVLHDFNRTAADFPRDRCVHSWVEQQAADHPERLAVSDGATLLTYGALNRRANRLARELQARGVGPEVRVAVCLDRSAAMIVAWLAAWKAGGAFVPLDPAYPPERLSFQLRDCGAPVLLADARHAAPIDVPGKMVRIDLSPEGEVGSDLAETDLPARSQSHHLAYVIYTSGSTGEPKGVEVEHRALANLVTWHQRTYAVESADRATHVASPAFDAAVWEIWPYLTAGASVHIPDEETRLVPHRLWGWLAEQRITLAFLPTPLAEAALAEPWPEDMALRVLLTGGDQLRRCAPAGFPCRFVNHYGPTENTVVATAGDVPTDGPGAPSIGRPIANTQAYVLDRDLQPVPIGVPGELYLGGESLARGYLNRPELNAERFVADPHGGRTPARLYRTGDIVRWRLDGQLEFLGRADHQVKIRGCRIELGEIEAALQRLPAVREAVVVARPDERGVAQLVGYVVGQRGPRLAEPELLEALRRVLPSYMVPAAVVVLDGWPLTPNGKIDRRALPEPPTRGAVDDPSFRRPQTVHEQAIARIWSTVLGRERIGAHDNFFECGGHSLLAAQAVTHVNAALGLSASVRLLFDYPTVAEFARELERLGAPAAPRPPVLRAKRRAASPQLETIPPC